MDAQRSPAEWHDWTREQAEGEGAELFGVADLTAAEGLETDPAELFTGMGRALVVGVTLAGAAVDQCETGPTPLYHHVYALANQKLDLITFGLAGAAQRAGFRALPLPASMLTDKTKLAGNVSYKALGRLAGLGWQGKSLLLVSPEHGPRFRMGVVLTDLPVAADGPVRNRCGSCTACTDACPAGAIKNVNTDDHYASRDEAIDFAKCASMCMEVFAKRPLIDKPICGVCVRACPWGAKTAAASG
ncbi:MAG TPA: 4Fe-4S double cluster binding domain-containing protein [Deferrisomatales bacterium]|nr:4Fe-4S double cluster binding domain-containing protein [Deferrisomatales bacterium]